ncbi:MAG: DtxR family transcriptional regulator [Sphaerochaetaceae bacterium]
MVVEIAYLVLFLILIFLIHLLFRQEKGLFWVLRKRLKLSDKVLSEDLLKCMAECQMEGHLATVKEAAGTTGIAERDVSRLFTLLIRDNLLSMEGHTFRLTEQGLAYGLKMIRAHRLYELFMAEHSGYEEYEWHQKAHSAEHTLTDEEIQELDKRLNFPIHDPHGDPIPSYEGKMKVFENSLSLIDLEPGDGAMILHMEDEPPEIYRQLVKEGLYPGQFLLVTAKTKDAITFKTQSKSHVLVPLMAANIQLAKRDADTVSATNGETLSDCKMNEKVRILAISQRISGSERRRLMDLGFLPGTIVEKELVSSSGDPMGFRVRDTLIALRKSQANLIFIEKAEHLVKKDIS